MCITNALQQKIRKHTDNGDLIAQFLADTIRGEYPDAKYHHKLEAAKLLSRYDSPDDTLRHSCGSRNPAGQGEGSGEGHSRFWGLIPTPEELAAAKNTEEPHSVRPEPVEGPAEERETHNPPHPVSYADILNYDIAHLIRQETAEGHTIAEFLSHVMTRRDQPFTPKKLRIKHTDRMAAAREILRRGHGYWGRKPKLKVYADDVEGANDYDTLHTDLAKRMREYNEHGTDAIRFLLDVMNDTSLDPEEGYTWHHKMSAAHEIIRRGWDTNYDKITPEMLQAYWQDQQSTRLSIGQKKRLAGLPAFLNDYDHYDNEDYEAIAQELRDQEDREEAADFKAASAPGKNPLSPGERARVRGNAPASSPSEHNAAIPNRHSHAGGDPAGPENPLPPHSTRHSRENGNPEGQGAATETTNPFVLSPAQSQSKGLSKDEPASNRKNKTAIPNRHSCEACPRPRSGSRNPAGQGAGYDGNETSSPSCTSMSVLPDDLDCYYEPLTPDDQAIFNYNSLIESGEFDEGEITFVPPSPAAHRDYAIALKQMQQAAASEGVPLLPNPLAGTLRRPAIRSP